MSTGAHDLRTAGRILIRHRSYAAISVGGLAAAIAACLLIGRFVSRELSFDQLNGGRDRTFRLLVDFSFSKASPFGAYTPDPAAAALRKDFPEVEAAGRLLPLPWNYLPITVGRGAEARNEDHLYYADPEILDLLGIPLRRGRRDKALDRAGTVLLTESMAYRYFGNLDPVGRLLAINGTPTEVTGVIADSPPSSHLRYKALLAYKTVDKPASWTWSRFDPSTYLRLRPGTDRKSFAAKLARLEEPYRGAGDSGRKPQLYRLQPLSAIHLEPRVARRYDIVTDPKFLLLLSLLAAVILLLAGINFVNLASAQAAGRAKEVGIRKSVGADKAGLIRQFLTEAYLLCAAAFLCGFALAGLALGPFNRLLGSSFRFADLIRPGFLAAAAGLFVLTGLAVGLYPALVLASFRPAAALQRRSAAGLGGGRVRRVLVLAQFASAAVLIAVTLAMILQIRSMKREPLGFRLEDKLVVSVPRRVLGSSEAAAESRLVTLRDELSRHPAVRSATLSQSVPGRGFPRYGFRYNDGEKEASTILEVLFADSRFLDDYGIGLRAGRPIRSDAPGREFLINEAAVGYLGWRSPEQALGRSLNMGGPRKDGDGGFVVGVVRDFHQAGLQIPIAPLVVARQADRYNMISLSVGPGLSREALEHVSSAWAALVPDAAFNGFFLKEDFARQYAGEEKTLGFLSAVAGLSILLAALGLIGLAAFLAEKRTKEIGIRIVVGATPARIMGLLLGEFVRAVLWANLLAAPIAYGIIRHWLRGFAFRSSPWFGMFAATLALTLGLAILSVGGRSLRATRVDPLRLLRSE